MTAGKTANGHTDNKTLMIAVTALMAAVLCILGPMSLPIGPIPISLTNLALYFMVYLVGTKISAAAFFIYMLLGLAGLPVFSGYAGGPQKLFGPTGGYIIGFLPMIFVCGLAVGRCRKNRLIHIAAFEAATWIPYLLGSAYLAYTAGMSFSTALKVGVVPFILLDLIKICAAAAAGPLIRERLEKAGVLRW